MIRIVQKIRISAKKVRTGFRMMAAGFLLLVYTTGAISVDLIHHSSHDHDESEVHTASAEDDACHRAMFHHDTKTGCQHKVHLAKTEKCKCSHVVFQSHQILVREPSPCVAHQNTSFFIAYHTPLKTTALQEPNLRGPPVI